MATNRKPRTGGIGAGTRFDECLQDTPLIPTCQVRSPISWLIRSSFIEKLVSQRYTPKNSLKVDYLLVFAEFLKEAGHVWN